MSKRTSKLFWNRVHANKKKGLDDKTSKKRARGIIKRNKIMEEFIYGLKSNTE